MNRLDLSHMEVYLVQWCIQKHGWTQRVEPDDMTRPLGSEVQGHYIRHCPECGKPAHMFRTDFVGI